MKKVFIIAIGIVLGLTGCKYDDGYLDPTLPTQAYFASKSDYTRTVIVGEGMYFKVGAAMSGVLENKKNETVDMIIDKGAFVGENKVLLPDNFYNSSELSGTISATIPAGSFLGYFTVKIDSLNFLNDVDSRTGKYALPVKIVGTSLQSVSRDLSTVRISVQYMARIDGYYLYRSSIKKESDGSVVEESYPNESDKSTYRMETVAPFSVRVTPAANSALNGVNFDLTLNEDNSVILASVAGSPEITATGENKYDKKTRDFKLNYKYTDTKSGETYDVSQELIFRNRMVDGVNQTREYLSYFN